MPLVVSTSFSASGMPATPDLRRARWRGRCRARRRARARPRGVGVRNAPTRSSTASRRASDDSASATAVISPSRSFAESSEPVRSQSSVTSRSRRSSAPGTGRRRSAGAFASAASWLTLGSGVSSRKTLACGIGEAVGATSSAATSPTFAACSRITASCVAHARLLVVGELHPRELRDVIDVDLDRHGGQSSRARRSGPLRRSSRSGVPPGPRVRRPRACCRRARRR